MIRQTIVADVFYPAGRVRAASEAAMLTSPLAGGGEGKVRPLMIMLPHAGWAYSGRVAGMVIARAEIPKNLVILGPCHRIRGKGLGVWDKGAWDTPLGPVPINEKLASDIIKAGGGFEADYAPHEQDHCIEVLLPLLKIARPEVRIVPIAISEPDPAKLLKAGEVLAKVLRQYEASDGEMPLLVVSSDMSHYISHDAARKQDAKALEAMVGLRPEELYRVVGEENISMCGVLPATLALQVCKNLNASKGELISYATSGQVSGDMDRVVGYAELMVS